MRITYMAASLAVLACMLPTVFAAESESSNSDNESASAETTEALEVIVVTGEKLGRALADTASSVNVTSGEDLADTPEQDLSELLRRSANVAAPRDDKFSLRGINNQGLTGRIRQAASVFVDGTRIEARGVVHAFDIEQVEIYRGPQSTTFGPNSLAGAIAVKTRDPEPYWGLNGLIGGGEAGSRQYALAGGGPITENLAFRLTGDFNETDGQVTNTTLHDDRWHAQERQLGRAKLLWTPFGQEGTRVLFSAQRTSLEEGTELLREELAEEGIATDNEQGFFTDDTDVYSLNVDVPVGDNLRFVSHSSYASTDQIRKGDYDAGPEDNGFFINETFYDNYSQEFRLHFDYSRWQAVAGIYGFDEDLYASALTRRLPYAFQGLELRADADSFQAREGRTYAIFGEVDFDITERWTLTAGLRHERNKPTDSGLFIATNGTLIAPDGASVEELLGIPGLGTLLGPVLDGLSGPAQPILDQINLAPLINQTGLLPVGGYEIESEHEQTLPKLGIRYALTDRSNVFLTYTQGYRNGGAQVTSEGVVNEFDPEFTDNIDLGYKGHWGPVYINANLFHVQWTDQQVRIRTSTIDRLIKNAGESELYGAELEVGGKLMPTLDWYMNTGYVRTEFIEFEDNDEDFSGNEFPYAPKYTGGAGLTWRPWDHYLVDFNVGHTEASFTDPQNSESEQTDAYTLLNMKLGYEWSNYGVYLFGRNLTDEYYVTDRLNLDSVGLRGVVVGERRVLGVQFEGSF